MRPNLSSFAGGLKWRSIRRRKPHRLLPGWKIQVTPPLFAIFAIKGGRVGSCVADSIQISVSNHGMRRRGWPDGKNRPCKGSGTHSPWIGGTVPPHRPCHGVAPGLAAVYNMHSQGRAMRAPNPEISAILHPGAGHGPMFCSRTCNIAGKRILFLNISGQQNRIATR